MQAFFTFIETLLSEVRDAFFRQPISWLPPGIFTGTQIHYNIPQKPIKSTMPSQKKAQKWFMLQPSAYQEMWHLLTATPDESPQLIRLLR